MKINSKLQTYKPYKQVERQKTLKSFPYVGDRIRRQIGLPAQLINQTYWGDYTQMKSLILVQKKMEYTRFLKYGISVRPLNGLLGESGISGRQLLAKNFVS